LGLTFKTSKFEVPCEWQKLLGLTLNTALQTIALKDGKALKVANLIDEVLQSNNWELLLLQKVAGNTIWLSMILPRIQSYATPLIDLITMINKVDRKYVLRYKTVGIDQEAMRSLMFLRSIFAHDPQVHINTFLNLKGRSRYKFWSDASGYDSPLTPTRTKQKNPTPGFCASYFHHKYAPIKCCFIKATPWPIIKRAIIKAGYDGRGLNFNRLALKGDELHICYLELIAKFLTILEVFFLAKTYPRFRGEVCNRILLFYTDSQNVECWFRKGRCPAFPFNRILEAVFHIEIALGSKIHCDWVPSDDQKADPFTRGVKHVFLDRTMRLSKRKKARVTKKIEFSAVKHSRRAIDTLARVIATADYDFETIDFASADYTILVSPQHIYKPH
jgi:hypothetical protein